MWWWQNTTGQGTRIHQPPPAKPTLDSQTNDYHQQCYKTKVIFHFQPTPMHLPITQHRQRSSSITRGQNRNTNASFGAMVTIMVILSSTIWLQNWSLNCIKSECVTGFLFKEALQLHWNLTLMTFKTEMNLDKHFLSTCHTSSKFSGIIWSPLQFHETSWGGKGGTFLNETLSEVLESCQKSSWLIFLLCFWLV